MKLSAQSLYEKRCRDGKPFYWEPQNLPATEFAHPSNGLSKTIDKIIAFSLHAELDVQSWVGEATKKELPVNKTTKALLNSNITDETIHYRQFEKLAKIYPVEQSHLDTAKQISQAWQDLPGHPLEKATFMEIGVFVPVNLAIMLAFGGQSNAWVAAKVGEDEQRHAALNRGILQVLSINAYEPRIEIEKLRKETISYMTESFSLFGINKDWFLEESTILVNTGNSPKLSNLTDHARYRPFFETENKRDY